ncbi:MAG: RDD family protein [Thermoanaerobaculia bacterium]
MADIRRESILGLDNIRLDLPIASLGSRSLSAFLDYLVLGLILILWVFLGGMAAALMGSTWALAVILAGVFLLDWGYFAGLEIALGGRTLGKKALGLRVVTAEGGSPGPAALLIRNLVRSLDILIGVVLIAIDPLSRRLGDRLAGTLVVHDRRPEALPVLGRVSPGWGPRELAAVESFLARADALEDRVLSWQLADRILDRIRRDAPELLAGVDTRTDPVAAIRQALQVEG